MIMKKRGAGVSINHSAKESGKSSAATVLVNGGKRLAIAGVVAVLALLAYYCISWFEQINVESIEFYGYSGTAESNRGVTSSELQQMAAPYNQQKYWRLDLMDVQLAVESHPWVRSATVYREWPNILRVGIDEHVPIARWNSQHLLTSVGSLIEDENALLISSLPRFVVPDAELLPEEKVRAMVLRYNELQKWFASFDQRIIEIDVSALNDLSVTLTSGSTIRLGDVQHFQRLGRLADLVHGELLGDWSKIAVADLRYARGVAIRWSDSDIDGEFDSLMPIAQSAESITASGSEV